MSTDLETQGSKAVGAASELPAPTYNPSDASPDDLQLRRIKVGETQADHVKRKRVAYGDIFTDRNKEDTDPVILAKGGDDVNSITTPPVLFFVLAEVRKSWSWNDRDSNEFKVRKFGDPEVDAQQEKYGKKGRDKWIPRLGYNYIIATPGHDDEEPAKLLLKGMSTGAARYLEAELRKAGLDATPYWEIPFELTAKQTTKGEYDFNVFQVRRANAADHGGDPAIAEIVVGVVEPLVPAAHEIAKSASALESVESTASEVTDAQSID